MAMRIAVTPQPTDVSAPPTPSLSYSNFRLNSMDSMSMSSLSYISFDASPVLRDFQEMTLSLTDDDDVDDEDKQHELPQISPSADHLDNSLFVFIEDTTQHTNQMINNDTDDDNDENPFLMGLALDIPYKKHSHHDDILPECEDEDEDAYNNNYFDGEFDDFEEYLFDDIDMDIDRKFIMKKYKLICNIGIGAFGIVDKALDRKSNQYVAIKQSRSIGDDILKQFRKETMILQEFADCEYIIDLIDYGRNMDVNQICIGLEYMDIGSLCNMKTYRMDQIKYISKCVLIALESLHDTLYVHNDIKPDNILISSAGNVKLIDFGCTMQMNSINEPLTKSIGSIRYLSFEKRFKSPIEYTTKSDIYSFGITLSEVFKGEHVHKKSLYDHYFIPATPILMISTDDVFSDFISKCVASDPDVRYSANQLLKHPFLCNVPQFVQFTMPSEE